jgi:lysophospholipase L1-like esterase
MIDERVAARNGPPGPAVAACGRLALSAVVVGLLSTIAWSAEPKAQQPPEVSILAEPVHAMVPLGGDVQLKIRILDRQGRPLSGELSMQVSQEGRPATKGRLAIGARGEADYRFVAGSATEPGIHAIEFRHPRGPAQKFFVDVLPPAEYAAFAQAAQNVRLPKLPARLLFIGDSLTDMYRGQNYVDKVQFWLAKRYGPQASVKNVGVGGDFITRVWQRLNHDPQSYRLSMYNDLYAPMPTHVFFFLGHNDSKLSSVSGYKTAVVEPAQFEDLYRQAVRKVQAESKARIIVMSTTSSVYEICKATADQNRTRGKSHNLFGKPEALEQFNAVARKVALECGADYLDVYEPTRQHPNKPSLFIRDGVHVSNLGNRLLALEILEHLKSP